MTATLPWRPAAFAEPGGRPGTVRCVLCPHSCELDDGEIGHCKVRRAHGGQLETATFATAVAHIHPVERKPFFHLRPGLHVLTLAAPGCTFTCTYCQNHRLSQYGRSADAPWEAEALDPAAIVKQASEAGLALGLSYSEPTLAAELTLALAQEARGRTPILWKSNGFVTASALAHLLPAVTALNVDLKAPDDARHRRLTGAPVGPVLDTLRAVVAAGVWLEVSTPLIPGFNDDDATIGAMARQVRALGAETPWHLLRFQPDYRLTRPPPTHPDVLRRAVDLARAEGLAHVYVERALGPEGRETRCARCGESVVRRDLWRSGQSRLRDGGCPACGAPVAGRW